MKNDIMVKLIETVSEFRSRLMTASTWDVANQNEPYCVVVILRDGSWFITDADETPNIPDFNIDDVVFIGAEFSTPQEGKYLFVDSDYGYRKNPRNLLKQLNQYNTDFTKRIG